RLRLALPRDAEDLRLGGLAGSAATTLVAALADAMPRQSWAVVAAGPAEADAAEADLRSLLDGELVRQYPQREALPYETSDHDLEVGGLRVEALEGLMTGRTRVLVTTVRALQERAEIPATLADLRLTLQVGDSIAPHALAARLEEMGFVRAPLVENVGDYALRGGILDLFGFGTSDPVRVEFWGDEIASLRYFDILDQRSTGEVRRVDVLPVELRTGGAEIGSGASPRSSLLDALPAGTILVELPGADPGEAFHRAWEHVLHLYDAERRRGGDPEPADSVLLPPAEIAALVARFARIRIVREGDADIRFNSRSAEQIDRDMDRLLTVLQAGAARRERTLVLCDNAGQLERLEELLGGAAGLPEGTSLALGTLAEGFVLEGAEPPVRVLTDHEIFRRARRVRRSRRFHGAAAIESLAQLRPGDYVVHLEHGIGRFTGLERVRVGDTEIEALALEYASGETLRVPVYRLDLIERWSPDRDDPTPPKLHKIGGKAWRNLRGRTERAIHDMTAELVELYAARQVAEGHAFSPDTRWQKEMESSFLYEDTPDQRAVTADVKRDMESKRPMDRLLCGDVGYGKTEVAIRAAFKAVQDGKQVAILAPTTILVEQHQHTLRQRLADYPIRIESLSRFRTAKDSAQVLAALAAGEVDIIVGTHRLIEPDVVFKDLGLLVIDEEQRFGVGHKERLKQLKRNIDVLSLSATPIPRTLHLSLAGLRDLSLLRTPPRDRMPIITHVVPWVDEVIEDAIRREIDRGGQVFFVHNRVQSIDAIAERVRRIVPDARIGVAHGQMPAQKLDDVMKAFLEGAIDVLVTSAIIENGLDVPTANTMIVDRADQFGLAQLYQLRGRVGRSHHRAYCYLIAPEKMTDDAEKRLRILEHYTELGSGYAVALKDLELRGAGNLLGPEQSGFVHAVGLDTYTRLLERAIRALRGEDSGVDRAPTEVTLDGAAYLPDDYVAEPAQKLHFYRRLSRAEEPAEVAGIRDELRDRYGPPPPAAERLLTATTLRLVGTRAGVERIVVRNSDARINFRDDVAPRLAVLQHALRDRQIHVEVRRTMPLSLVLQRHGAEPLAETIVAALEVLARPRAQAA
ncbi:MAG TPA: transcription-repair coupling factor, partial [Longimicrobiales bacterium]|nr:transcription-repair coupling factor [Longimicrobiales bacterium]